MAHTEVGGWTPGTPAAAPPGEEDESGARAAELASLLAARRGERHLVAIQDFPDPDAISSGLAYQEIARQFGIEAEVVYDGQISHPENLALVNLLGIHLTRFHDGMELDRFNAAVFVDNQGTTTHLTDRLRAAGVPTLAVIDHHAPQGALDPIFSDVRPVGAAATLFTEYLQSGRILRLEEGSRVHVQLATALMHGLHSETDGFVHAREPEYRAAAYLSGLVDASLLERVLCVQKSRATMDVIEAALARREIRNGFSVAGVGYVRWADRDAIPQAADFLLMEETVHTAVVYGILCGDDDREVVSGSLRTSRVTLEVDGFLKDALGSDLRGVPYGGGRSRAGGFEIDLGFLAGEDDAEQRAAKWELFEERIRRKIFREAGVDEEEEDGDCRRG
ncbi:MAG TPA: bifunctional oligoribonuclease/PAP phosphatase NrnA [Longimicrobiaceae bacterium]